MLHYNEWDEITPLLIKIDFLVELGRTQWACIGRQVAFIGSRTWRDELDSESVRAAIVEDGEDDTLFDYYYLVV